MKTKIKIYRMPLARVFPATHPMAGRETCFREAIKAGIAGKKNVRSDDGRIIGHSPKLHTIRAINPLSKTWFDKIKEVQKGNAVLVLYQWKGKPYSADGCTNLFVFGMGTVKDFIDGLMKSDRYKYAIPVIDSGIGTQELLYPLEHIQLPRVRIDGYSNSSKAILLHKLANNDGLTIEDFKEWFKGYDLSKPMAIVHFTKFRY